ncbi:hypothetical protein ACYOEI_08830 [Singulisphaera rosea]
MRTDIPGVSRTASLRRFLGIVPALALVGCGGGEEDKLPREAVWGKVSYDGIPLAKGAIQLRSAPNGGGTPIVIGGLIRDGEYSIARAEGPVPGTYQVSITEETESKLKPGEAPGPFLKPKASRLPTIYNMRSTLKAEVKAGQAESIDFDLKKAEEPAPGSSKSRFRHR